MRRTRSTSIEVWTNGSQSTPSPSTAVAGLPDGELRFYALDLATPANRKFESFFEGNGMRDLFRNVVANSARRLARRERLGLNCLSLDFEPPG